MSTQTLEINSIREFTSQNLQPYLKKFQKMQNTTGQDQLGYLQWINFSSYVISELIKVAHGKFAQLNIEYAGHQQQVKREILEDENITFLTNWISKTQIYKAKQINRNVKDRKNSFFRLINRHLKKQAKMCFDSEKCEFLNIFQSKLNGNMVSGKDIKKLCELWDFELKSYLESSQIIVDILKINKSKVQHYYLLHLNKIIVYAQQSQLSSFPFYEKINGLDNSIKRIIDKVFSHQKKQTQIYERNTQESQQTDKELKNWSFQIESQSKVQNILQQLKESPITVYNNQIGISLLNQSQFFDICQ